MTAPQIEIKQGIARSIKMDFSTYPDLAQGVTWMAAFVNQSTDMRYVANVSQGQHEKEIVFTWPSGLDPETLELDDEAPNGTAHMSVGTYNLEVYTSDLSDMGTLYERFRVVKSNLMTKNAKSEQE